jgi:hypothetical protein
MKSSFYQEPMFPCYHRQKATRIPLTSSGRVTTTSHECLVETLFLSCTVSDIQWSFLANGNGISIIYPLHHVVYESQWRLERGNTTFFLSSYSNFTSIPNCFRDLDNFLAKLKSWCYNPCKAMIMSFWWWNWTRRVVAYVVFHQLPSSIEHRSRHNVVFFQIWNDVREGAF